MKLFSFFKSRRLMYAMAMVFVLAVNGNAVAEPLTARFRYINSHRQVNAVKYGTWDTQKDESPVRSIHAVMLHTGKVLLIAGSGNDEKSFGQKSFRSVLWDPKIEKFTDIPTPWDAFCSGHTFLPDGKVLVAGGTKAYEDLTKVPKQEYQGLKDSYVFDPITERYEKVSDMNFSRWYPTLVGLPNGSVLASSGLDEKGNILWGQTEIYDPAKKQWFDQPQLNRYFPTYPALILASDGRLFFTGSNAGYGPAEKGRQPGLWNLHDNTFQAVPGIDDISLLETSASLLLPPAQDQKFMVLGGGGIGDSPIASDKTHIVDLKQTNPAYKDGPKLAEATRYMSAVILPDDTVFTTGGSRGYRDDDILSSAIYDPSTNTFSKAASPFVGRNYHSEALLLPDGRVATFGSNPLDNSFEMRIEVYSPAYLFKGERPKIIKIPDQVERGQKFDIATSDPSDIVSAKLMRPSAVTHVTDVEQRSINLPFTRTENGLTVEVSDNPNLLPSGWYMVFVTNKKGIPAEASWIQVK